MRNNILSYLEEGRFSCLTRGLCVRSKKFRFYLIFLHLSFNWYSFSADEIILNVTIQRGSGNFEITSQKSILVTGNVYTPENIDMEFVNKPSLPLENGVADHEDAPYTSLNSDDVYKELRIRGYNYKDDFKSIVLVEKDGNRFTNFCTYTKILPPN